jgi:hypothetical protein
MCEEVPKCLGSGGKAARNSNAGVSQLADHLAERGILAADGFDIRHPKAFK